MPTAKLRGHYDRLFTPNDRSRETRMEHGFLSPSDPGIVALCRLAATKPHIPIWFTTGLPTVWELTVNLQSETANPSRSFAPKTG
jgi:hypothetical protein